jgi:hypothetical protein
MGVTLSFSVMTDMLFAAPQGQDDNDVALARTQSIVGTGPYFGLGSSYDGSDLLILQPNLYKDLNLLKENQFVEKQTLHGAVHSVPHVQMSGTLEAQLTYTNRNSNTADLSGVGIDFLATINPWLTGYIDLGYDSGEPPKTNFGLYQGFVTVGNLDQSPVYASVGRFYVPFGNFGSGLSRMSALVKSSGRIKADALNVGFYAPVDAVSNVYGAVALYNGRTHIASDGNRFDQFASALNYKYNNTLYGTPFRWSMGVGYTNNILEAEYSQRLLLSPNPSAPILTHYVPAGDIYTHIGMGPVILRAEYLHAFNSVSMQDITFDGRAIRPQGYALEAEYDMYCHGKAVAWVLHFSQGYDNVLTSPTRRAYAANVTVGILKNTALSFEFDRQFNTRHRQADAFNGKVLLNPENLPLLRAAMDGKAHNTAALTLDIYF